MAHHKDPDHALRKAIGTERFELVPLSRLAAFRLSYPWNADPELMRNLFHSSKPMRRWKWYKRVVKGIGKRKFAHAIVPKGETKPIEVTLTREVIKVQSVKSKLVEPGYGYVRVTQFQESTTQYLVKHLNELFKQGPMKGLVLDLRNDPGGFRLGLSPGA